jgi:3-(3-hydroxy-phenyl)propionate hydroxylase
MTQRLPDSVDVIIVGAGPTGLTLANLLGAYGVHTLLVEMRETTSDLPRAIVLDDEGARTLQTVGLDEAAIADATEGLGTRYETAHGSVIAEVGRGGRELGFPKRYFISQPRLERTLAAGLTQWDSVQAAFATRLLKFSTSEEGIDAVLEHSGGVGAVRARWLVACDGGRSPIREGLGLTFDGNTYGQDWIVLDLSSDPDTRPVTRFICDPARPAVSVPAPAGGRRYEFMLLPGESREEVLKPDFLARLLAPHRDYRQEDVIRAAVYTFHARIASRWRAGRVLLAGDAAHLTPPFAGQGMNAGLRDAYNLAWKLSLAVRGAADSSFLDSYEQERRDPCMAMIQLAVLMGKVIMPASAEEAAMQAALMRLTAEAPALKQYLFEMRFKPKPEYASGVLVRDADDVPASLVGRMIPQPLLRAGGSTLRLDDALGRGFALISQSAGAAEAAARMDPRTWKGLAPKNIALNLSGASAPGSGYEVVPADHAIAAPLRAHRDQVLLVRPDRYVACALDIHAAEKQALRFSSLLAQHGAPAEGANREVELQTNG